MNIYALYNGVTGFGPKRDYDYASGFVVIAKSPKAARKLIITEEFNGSGSEGKELWLDKNKSNCYFLGKTTKKQPISEIVMRDFVYA